MRFTLILALVALAATFARADVVELSNGDKLTGKIGEVAGGKMKFSSPVLGDITIELANVKSYSTDEPVRILQKKGEPTVTDKIVAGDAKQVEVAGGTTLPTSDIRAVNPPAQAWSGYVLGNLSIARGNTETIDAGVEAQAQLRRREDHIDDRFTLYGRYNFANSGTGNNTTNLEENWLASAKYDYFFKEKWYAYGLITAEQDHIANLDIRLTPGAGLGYQWFDQPDFHLSSEAGASWVYEYYDPGGKNDYVALRLAYHVDKKLNEKVTVFHNLVYLPSFEDPTEDYLMRADAGFRTDMTKNLFTEVKVEWEYDSTPSPGRSNNDYRYIVGVGWRF